MKCHQRVLAAIALLALTAAPVAFAHDIGSRGIVVNSGFVVVDRRGPAPRFLSADPHFRRWYVNSRYRYDYRLNWPQLYDVYCIEAHHYRPVRHVVHRVIPHDRRGYLYRRRR